MKLTSFNSGQLPQQTFLVFQDVFKTSWARIQRNNFSSSKTSLRRVCNTSSKNVFKTSSRASSRRVCKEVLKKTSCNYVLKMSSRLLEDVLEDKKCYTEDVFTKTNVCWEKSASGQLQNNTVNDAVSITINRVIIEWNYLLSSTFLPKKKIKFS